MFYYWLSLKVRLEDSHGEWTIHNHTRMDNSSFYMKKVKSENMYQGQFNYPFGKHFGPELGVKVI